MARTDEEVFEDVWASRGTDKNPYRMRDRISATLFGNPDCVTRERLFEILRGLRAWKDTGSPISVWDEVDEILKKLSPMSDNEIRSFMHSLRGRRRAAYALLTRSIPDGMKERLIPDLAEDRAIDGSIHDAVCMHESEGEKAYDEEFKQSMKRLGHAQAAWIKWRGCKRCTILRVIRWPFLRVSCWLSHRINPPIRVFLDSEKEKEGKE